MAFNSMAGMGQYNMSRGKAGTIQQPKGVKKQGFFGEDEDSEPSMYFNNQSAIFPPTKEMITSASPSQMSSPFSSNLYGQPPVSSMGNIALQQRGLSNTPFQRNTPGHVTPTSIGPNFSMGLQQQQPSPNSSLFPMGQRGILNQMQANQAAALNSQLKRPIPSSLIGSHSSTSTTLTSSSMSRFGGSQLVDSLSSMPGHNKINQQAQQMWNSKYDNQPSLDLSEFPTLGNRSAPVNPMPSVRNYGMVSKPVQEPAPEFQIQQEDFPALPGAQNPPTATLR